MCFTMKFLLRKIIQMQLCKVLLSVTIISFIFLYLKITYYDYSSSDYYASIEKAYNPDWMKGIPDDKLLSDLSIPGTHDSMAVWGILCCLDPTPKSLSNDIAKLQQRFNGNARDSLARQLEAGIRAIDIRVIFTNSTDPNDPINPPQFVIHHGLIYQYANFLDVLKVTSDFLNKNPSETIIMRLKLEDGNSDDSSLFRSVVLKYRDSEPYGKILYYPSVSGDGYMSIPKLGDVRGKVLILKIDRKKSGVYYGFGIYENLIDIQDIFELNGIDASGQKFKYVTDHFNATANPENYHKIMVNFINAHTKFLGIPGTLQNGPSAIAHDVNKRVWTYLSYDYSAERRTGILMFDYPGWKLIDKVISFNYNFYMKPSP